MGNSISSRQRAIVNSGFIDLLGEPRTDNEITLDAVQDALLYLAAKYVETATNKLNEKDKVSSGFLTDSIKAMPVKIMGKVYSVDINIASYYKFVDAGVNGWAQGQGSPYTFKQYTGRSGTTSSPMVTAIRKWLITEGLQATRVKKPIVRREARQKKITDTSTTAAIIISKAIKKKGLKPTHFWKETETEVTALAKDQFAAALKVDIIYNLYGNSN